MKFLMSSIISVLFMSNIASAHQSHGTLIQKLKMKNCGGTVNIHNYPDSIKVNIFGVQRCRHLKIGHQKHFLEKGRFGYKTLNLTLPKHKYSRTVDLQLFTGVENIFDRAYRNHLSTNRGLIALEPGRNIFAKIKLSW